MPKNFLQAALLCTAWLASAQQNLVVNGNFATGDLTGWVDVGGTSVVCPGGTPGGSCEASFAAAGFSSSSITQSIPTTPGSLYTVSFSLQNTGISGDTPPNQFSATFAGQVLSLSNQESFDWRAYSFTATASSSSSPLQFAGRNNCCEYDLTLVSVVLSDLSLVGLTGNNLVLAQYLNENAPSNVVSLFNSLGAAALPGALEAAAPTRNAFATFASQNGYLAVSQICSDHARQRRFRSRESASSHLALLSQAEDDLLAAASVRTLYQKQKPELSEPESPPHPEFYTVWGTAFGAYIHEKAQLQTPAFHAGSGGFVVAFDYTGLSPHVVGAAGAYVHTHLDESGGMGEANIDQGYLTGYAILTARQWYFDLGLWGGYYHIDNQRKISFPGFHQTAKSEPQGWQLAPHVEIGYDGLQYKEGKWGIEPFVMADWVANWEDSFHEHGAGSLNMGQEARFCSLLRGEAGLRLYEILYREWGRIAFREKGSYAYQKAFHTGSIQAFLVGSPGSFTVTTLTGAQNLGVFEFSVLFFPKSPKIPYFDLRYQGEFGSMYQSHQGMLEIGKDF